MKLKWYGTATILLEQDGVRLLFDPFFSLNNRDLTHLIEESSAVEYILITHGHLDHIAGIPEILKHGNGTAAVYCTAKPRDVLISKGIDESFLHKIAPGDVLTLGPYEVRVLKGKHIVFNKGLLVKKILNPRNLLYLNNSLYLFKENRVCAEAGETVVYDVAVANKRILLLGSLNLDDDTEYPKGADLLILPYQGRSDICRYTLSFIDRLKPKMVLLDHFDDSFPPISSSMKTSPFISLMREKYPEVPVVCPRAGAEWSFT